MEPLTSGISLPKIRKFDGHDWYSTNTTRRNLPHWELKGSTYFLTFRVLPEIGRLFKSTEIAELMITILRNEHEKKYLLEAYVIMPDHLHLILKPLFGFKISKLLQNLKGSSAFQLNKLISRQGSFWQKESFDRILRDQADLKEKWDYIKDNPVKEGLVFYPEDYPFSSFYNPTKFK